MNNVIQPRQIALEILTDINDKGAYSNIALKKALQSHKHLSPLDKAFITEIVNGTLKYQIQIDFIIKQFTKMKLNKIAPMILNILRIGVYQIKFMTKVPVAAACNESVKLAKKFGHTGTVKFTNGVLRNIARNVMDLPLPSKKDAEEYISIKYSHPKWLVRMWLKYYSRDFVEKLCEANNRAPYVTLRINTLKVNREEVKKIAVQLQMEIEDGVFWEEAIRVKGMYDLKKTDLYTKGYVQVQDESSMLVGHVVAPKEGDFVLDVTSAPGGKATHVAQLMQNKGTVIARDLHQHKIKLIEETSQRLGITCIQAQIFDATKLDLSLIDQADLVLVDAPCSGLGIIRKKPDIKMKKNECDFKDIIEIQKNILSTCHHYVKQGGSLIYSTCTINPEENIEQVNWFIKNYDFELEDISKYLPEKLRDHESALEGYIQLYPHIHHCDGFFIARLKRKFNVK